MRCAPPGAFPVGSEEERYARLLQVLGASGREPWTLRDFGPRQAPELAARDSTLPWQERTRAPRPSCWKGVTARLVPPRVQVIHNSGFPVGWNDAALWAGRGVTVAAEGGLAAAWGAVSLRIAPLIFVAQNSPFRTGSNGLAGARAFADWRTPEQIDLPQRFGDAAYARLDPGQSSLRVDVRGLAAGLSTANQHWGPATDHPVLLGNNAPGFPHLFAGTARPANVWRFGRAHARVFWGRLDESAYSPLADSAVARLASGIVAVFQPAILPGLELGGGRFFHVLQDRFRLNGSELWRPFGALLKINRARQLGTDTGDEFAENQLASVFARVVLPASGFEVYGEYGREDHNWDLREFWLMPDHDAAYLVGFRKAWRGAREVRSIRGEVLNSRISHLALVSNQAPWYVHTTVREGHTHQGQALGSAAAYGGGGSIIAFDRYTPEGRLSLSWERLQLGEGNAPGTAPVAVRNDVAHVWRINALRFTRRGDLQIELGAIREFNRYLLDDAFSVRTMLSISPRRGMFRR